MAHIDYFFSTLSPYAYLAGTRLEELTLRHRAKITYKPFDIMSLFPRTGGAPVPQRHASRVDYGAQELPRQARKVGLTLNMKPKYWPVNAAPSSYAIIAAQNAGGGDVGALVHGLLRASWGEERDISDEGVIRACLTEESFCA